MADIALGAEIRREFLASFLQEINSDGTRVAPHSASRTQPHKFNDATGHARCRILMGRNKENVRYGYINLYK